VKFRHFFYTDLAETISNEINFKRKMMKRKFFLIGATTLFWLSQFEVAYAQGVGITSGRLNSLIGVVAGLVSVIIGWQALRSVSNNSKSVVSIAIGLVGVILSLVHLAGATGDFGTGSGRLGAIVAMVLALIGIVLGGFALAKSRRKNHKT
jgi:hypothetical protein